MELASERSAGFLPILGVLRNYKKEWLGGDLRGGIGAAVVTIPTVIAYAALADLAPEHGLYAALLGMLGYALFASSRHLIAGPDGAITLLVGSIIGPLAGGDPARLPVLAAMAALFGGAVLFLGERLRAGVIAELLSKPVLIGYMSGAALVLVATQLGRFFGIHLEQQGFFLSMWELASRVREAHVPTLTLGLSLIAVLAAMRRWLPRLPGALVIVVLALVVSHVFHLEARGVSIVASVPSGLPAFRLPMLPIADLRTLLPGALAIAVLTFSDGILMARGFAAKAGYTVRPSQELRALAAANVAASLFQGFSVGASQSRTTVNQDTGGKTQVASLVAVVVVALFLLFFTPLLRELPTVALASILVFAGIGMCDVPAYRRLRQISPHAFVLALVVTGGVLALGVAPGILVGVVLSLVYLLVRLARPTDIVLQEVASSGSFHDLGDTGATQTVPGLIAYRFYAPLLFANADHFAERVRHLVATSPTPVRWLLIDAQAITTIDVTGADTLAGLIVELRERAIAVKIARANRPLRETLARLGLGEELEEANLFPSVHAAVAAFRRTETDRPAPRR